MAKISGTPLDRIVVHIEVPTVEYPELSSKKTDEPSCVVTQRVEKPQEIRRERFRERMGLFKIADMQSKGVRSSAKLTSKVKDYWSRQS